MIDKNTRGYVYCETNEQQEMMLDIFEMLEMRWRAGEKPRGFKSRRTPMNFSLNGTGRFAQAPADFYGEISASELYNQWVSLKIKYADKITIVQEDEEDDEWVF